MYVADGGLSFRRQNDEGWKRLVAYRGEPETRKIVQGIVLGVDIVGLFRDAVLIPFVEAVGGEQAAALVPAIAEAGCRIRGFDTRVDVEVLRRA